MPEGDRAQGAVTSQASLGSSQAPALGLCRPRPLSPALGEGSDLQTAKVLATEGSWQPEGPRRWPILAELGGLASLWGPPSHGQVA